MSDCQTIIYLVILFFYAFAYYIAMRDRKESAFQNFMSVVVFVLAIALFAFPLFFDGLWRFVCLTSIAVIVATIFVEPASSGTSTSNPNPIGLMVSFRGHLFVITNSCFSLENL